MIKKILFIFILLPLTGFSQNVQTLREQAAVYYNNGDFLKSYETLNKIKDKKVLSSTDVNLQKAHLENILEHRFFKKTKLNDSLYKVYIRTNILKSQGVYNEKSKKYTVPPVYDSVPFHERYFKYLSIYKNRQEAFVNIETGKVIVPLGKHSSNLYNDCVFASTLTRYDSFSFDDILNIFDINGNLLFKNIDTFKLLYYQNYAITKSNNKYKIIDLNTKKVVLDNFDYYFNPPGAIVENDVLYDNVWLPFHKNNQYYLYKITPDEIVDTHKFDTYVPLYSNYNYFDNAITKLINLKDNAPFIDDTISRISFFSNYTIVKKDNKYGIFNLSKDQYYKEPVYDSISNIGNTFYNGKWINLIYGEEICMPSYDRPEGIIFKKNNLFGLMDLGGKIIADANYDEIRFLWNRVFILRKGLNWGFVGVQKEDKLVTPQFDYIEYRGGDFGNIGCHKKKIIIKYFRNGNEIDPVTLDNQTYKKYVYFDESVYDNINSFNRGTNNEFDREIFGKRGKYGLDDHFHKEIVEAKYTKLEYGKKNRFIASLGSSVGLIDLNGKVIIPIKYKNVESNDFISDLFFVTFDNGLKAIFNSEGVMLYPPEIKEAAVYYSDPVTKTSYVTIPAEGQKNSEESKNVIEIKNCKAQKIKLLGNYFLFLNSNNIMVGSDYASYKTFFYDLKNGKNIEGQFNYYYVYDQENRRIFAKRDYYYDTVIDSVGNVSSLEHPFEVFENDNFFFKEGNDKGVMNKNLQAANFRYPVLKNSVDREYQFISPYPSKEYREKASSYFKFNTNTKSIKNGIIKFDGTIIVEPEIYDDIQLMNFGKENNYYSSGENEFIKKNRSDVFLCTKDKKEYKTVALVTSNKELVAKFELNKKGSWNFSDYNNSIIIRSPDSVKVYDIKSKKIIFEKPTNRFEENRNSGYTISYIEPKTAEIVYQKYDYKGNLMATSFVNKKAPYFGKENENYIAKRNDRYGVINARGEEVVPFEYDYLQTDKGKVFISKNDNVFGIIDATNQTIIDKKYQDIQLVEVKDRYNSYRIGFVGYKLKEKNKFGLLDSNLKTLLPVEFDTLKLSESIITAKKDTLLSVYDYTGKEIFSAAVDSVDLDSNNSYHIYKNGKRLFRDYKGKIMDTNPYLGWGDQLKIKHSKQIEGKYYLVKNDSIIHKTALISFEQVDVAEDFMGQDLEYLLIKDENNFYGLYTEELKQILPFVYNEITILKNEDFFIVKKDEKYGVINYKNQVLIPFEYDNISFDSSAFFHCTKNKKMYHITPQNKRVWVKMPKAKKQKD